MPYLLYEPLILYTDHTALHCLFNISDPSGHLVRWRLRLAEYAFDLKHKTGGGKAHADALSCLETAGETALDDCFYDTPSIASPNEDVTTDGHNYLDNMRADDLYVLNKGPSAADPSSNWSPANSSPWRRPVTPSASISGKISTHAQRQRSSEVTGLSRRA